MTVHTLLIADASGSMQHLADDVRGGHNSYLEKVAASADPDRGENVYITLAVFNTKVTIIDNAVPIAQATKLNRTNYAPSGGTALLDAVGQTLQVFLANTTLQPGDKVFVFIQTDGEENSSVEYTNEQVAAIIQEMEARDFAFVFSGAGPQNWAEQGRAMGLNSTTKSAATGGGILRSYRGREETVIEYLNADTATRTTFNSATASGLIQASIDNNEEGK